MISEVANRLEALIAEIQVQFGQANKNTWSDRPKPGKWSRKEILGHLVDSALNNIQRFIRSTYEQDFKLVYNQDAWVAAQNYQRVPLEELFDLWLHLNRQIVSVMRAFPADRLSVEIDLGKEMESFKSVEFIMTDYIEHMIHHQQQLFTPGQQS